MNPSDELGSLFSSLSDRFGFPRSFLKPFCSAIEGFQRSPIPSYEQIKHSERLEFLGDSCLQFCITKLLHQNFPDEDEGVLSSVKGNIVSGASLGSIAEDIGFKTVSKGATKARLKSFLPDSFEAFLGALFLHSGINSVDKVISELFTDVTVKMVKERSFKPLKSMLQEISAKELSEDPVYKYAKIPRNKFRADIFLTGSKVVSGRGFSKKEAEDNALEYLFPRLNLVFKKLGKLPNQIKESAAKTTTRKVVVKTTNPSEKTTTRKVVKTTKPAAKTTTRKVVKTTKPAAKTTTRKVVVKTTKPVTKTPTKKVEDVSVNKEDKKEVDSWESF